MRSGVDLINLHRDGEVIVVSGLDHLSLDVVALPSLQIDPGTDLAGCLIEPIVPPIYGTVAVRNESWCRSNEVCSIVGVYRVEKKLAIIITRGIKAVLPSSRGRKPTA
jgi:hypothetical protein